MKQHVAYTMLDGKEVDGYILRIAKIVRGEDDVDQIDGTLRDTTDRNRRSIPLLIQANESDLDTEMNIGQLLSQIEDEIYLRRSSIMVNFT
jgi:hypothetical protein